MQYIIFNGNIYPEQEQLLQVSNRGFKYGDGFFESMVMFNKKVPLFHLHWSRIEYTAQVLAVSMPRRFDFERFHSILLDLCAVNESVANARIRLQFYRKGEGLYLPEHDELGYVMSLDKIPNEKFVLGEGLHAGFRPDCFKPVSPISDLKNSSALLYVVYAQQAAQESWKEMILPNGEGFICEALSSNVFVVKGDKVTTPPITSGCVNGVMRTYLLSVMEDIEERDLTVEELNEADEIILTNATRGVQWVKAFNGKTYGSKTAAVICDLINDSLEAEPST